eukprot:CAMPEP_0194309712 /NCGR_PEP_ID=MMETSP0171-20130528/6690_1 /TAXON_ID=218684 /ORGANISM="Corethron pennatum, Strain L29A3" /LENGTH=38 /DNA_ID= /DNA_START= /DNA_END= /DNA_ORIENTATION=
MHQPSDYAVWECVGEHSEETARGSASEDAGAGRVRQCV